MYYSYVEIEYVATSFTPAKTNLAVKLLMLYINSLTATVTYMRLFFGLCKNVVSPPILAASASQG